MKIKKTINYKRESKKTKIQNMDVTDKNGMYPIHVAIQNNDLGALEILINNGANLNKYSRDRDTPILLAIKENNSQIVEKLLEEGVDLKRTDANQNSPIMIAMNDNNQECIDLLTGYSTSSQKTFKSGTKNVRDSSCDFVTALINLLSEEIISIDLNKKAAPLTQKVLSLLQHHLDLKKISKNIAIKLNTDINYRISQFLSFLESNVKIANKDVLNLARKIIVIIQDCKKISLQILYGH